MKIAVSGYSGFIGTAVMEELSEHEFTLLSREDIYGDYRVLQKKLKGANIVMNFAGSSISKRWTKKNRKAITMSREFVTRNLSKAINGMENKPRMFVNASAIGIYEKDKKHTETSKNMDNGFLGRTVIKWEQAADEVDGSVRLIKPRIGMVLGKGGGALNPLIPLFKSGLGGPIGSGRQVYSFIHIYDVVKSIRFLIENEKEGVYNLTSPQPVTNKEFTASLGKHLKRPALLWVPSFMLRIVMGKSSEIVTGGQTVYPRKLQDQGYKFTFASIDDALNNLLLESEPN
ncbi:MAG: TIGR01777 family oxidoreductase [Bacteroidales bacterium]|nr:TIGR01777 family oxidoreductase [Bacteroidales bacterium]